MFIGRATELQTLNSLFNKNTFEFLILYGRRRIGKTSLLKEFLKDKTSVFYMSEEKNDHLNILTFCQSIYAYFGVHSRTPLLNTWNDIFSFISEQDIQDRFVLVIDEFPYLAQENASLMSKLQHSIDHEWADKNIFLVLCGSSVSFMENELMGAKSPLFGRRTSRIKLEPFQYLDSSKFCPNYTLEDKVRMYGIFGGVPQYLKMIDPSHSLKENVCNTILSSSSYLYDEPIMLLKTELRNPNVYNSILDVMGKGATRINDISMKIHEEPAKCSKYIQVLIHLGIIQKRLPLGNKETGRNTIYQISDPFFHFWYRFVSGNLHSIEMMSSSQFYDHFIAAELDTYIGLEFELVCTQYMQMLNYHGKLPFLATKIGRWWGNNKYKKCEDDVDILLLGDDKAMFCECKWRTILFDNQELSDLKDVSRVFDVKDKYYALFSKSGYTLGVKEQLGLEHPLMLLTLEDLYAEEQQT